MTSFYLNSHVAIIVGTDPGVVGVTIATHHEWPCNYSDMQIKALHY